MSFCGKCGTQLLDGSHFCHLCGAKFSSKIEICKNCGHELVAESRFCNKCGYPTKLADSKQAIASENISDMIKCPNCGGNVGRMDAACHFCGMQIVQRSISNSVKSFAEELARIESEANDATDNANNIESFWSSAFLGNDSSTRNYRNKLTEKQYGSKAFERKISFIIAFPIPNTVEEITEFILLAVANIDTKFGMKTPANERNGKPGASDYTEIKLATTWINKLEQAYNKASIIFPNDPLFPKVQSIYTNKMRELNRL